MEELHEKNLGGTMQTKTEFPTNIEQGKSTIAQFSRFFRMITKGKSETSDQEPTSTPVEPSLCTEIQEEKDNGEAVPSLEGILDQLHHLESCIAQWVQASSDHHLDQIPPMIAYSLNPLQKWTIRLMAAGVTIFLGLSILFGWSSQLHKHQLRTVQASMTMQLNDRENQISNLESQLLQKQKQIVALQDDMEAFAKQKDQDIAKKSAEVLKISKQLAKAQSEKEYLKVKIKMAEDVSLNLAGEKEKLASQVANRNKPSDDPKIFPPLKTPKQPSQLASTSRTKKGAKSTRIELPN